MPYTWFTALIGSLALIGFPGFAGFYSKDIIIEAVGKSTLAGHELVHYALLLGVFVTALYSFRMYFLVFHGKERFDTSGHHGHESAAAHGHDDHGHGGHGHDAPKHDDHGHHGGLPKESPWVVVIPLIMLAIPSVIVGAMYVGDMPYGHFFDDSIFVHPEHNVLGTLAEEEFHGAGAMMLHGFIGLPFLLAMAGVGSAWFLYLKRPEWPERIAKRFRLIYRVLERKYGFDEFNDWFFARGSRGVGDRLWRIGDVTVIDGMMVNGSARVVGWSAAAVRWLQSGYLYHYAFAMILGLLLLFGLFVLG
jgi:NADH-quinone oxidoreductase subunit L